MTTYDLLFARGTLLDPAQTIHARRDVAFASGRVAAVAEKIDPATARQVIECAGLIVAPGLIDLDVHVFPGVSHYGIDPDPHCIAKGVTTAMDAGSAGADIFSSFPCLYPHPQTCLASLRKRNLSK